MSKRTENLVQIVTAFIICSLCLLLINNLIINLINKDMGLNFAWLLRPAGFSIGERTLNHQASDSYLWSLAVGWINSLKVISVSLILSTFLGLISGILRLSSNLILKTISRFYVALIRQIPLLIQLMFWYFVAFLKLGETPFSAISNLIIISNQGINLMGVEISVEFSALVVGLTIFTGASIAEVVRGGLNSVKHGQWEAFRSLGISEKLGIRKIILPQALPAIIPGLTSQYLNLAKNSTLAIAIGYADIYAISDTSITQTGRAIEGFVLLLFGFLILNLLITNIMEILNRFSSNSKYGV